MSRATSLTGPWLALATAYGGVGGLATALGASTMSVYRWGTGASPVRPTTALAIAALARRKRVRSPV